MTGCRLTLPGLLRMFMATVRDVRGHMCSVVRAVTGVHQCQPWWCSTLVPMGSKMTCWTAQGLDGWPVVTTWVPGGVAGVADVLVMVRSRVGDVLRREMVKPQCGV